MTSSTAPERIPFWRNVKTIGIVVQVAFVLGLALGAGVLVSNVLSALRTANLPADFSWMGSRAGIPIAETPIPYAVSDPYWRALLIGFLNTLRVALIGVVLASLIGVLVGVMRLASNWLVRSIASAYIELLRNIPLAVQIVFWYSAVLLPIPPRLNNPIELPGGVLLSNVGLAFPFLYPTYRFGAWVPWLVVGIVLAVDRGDLARPRAPARRPRRSRVAVPVRGVRGDGRGGVRRGDRRYGGAGRRTRSTSTSSAGAARSSATWTATACGGRTNRWRRSRRPRCASHRPS